MKLSIKIKAVLSFLAFTLCGFGQSAPLDSIITWSGNVEKIRAAFSMERSTIDKYFDEDYFISVYYSESDSVNFGVAFGDFKSEMKMIQFEITKDGVTYYPITSKRALKPYWKLIGNFEDAVPDIKKHYWCGFYTYDHNCKGCDKWVYLSYISKTPSLVKRYEFLSLQPDYSHYLTFPIPNLIEELSFYGLCLTDPQIHRGK